MTEFDKMMEMIAQIMMAAILIFGGLIFLTMIVRVVLVGAGIE